jgi:hypothetical protein
MRTALLSEQFCTDSACQEVQAKAKCSCRWVSYDATSLVRRFLGFRRWPGIFDWAVGRVSVGLKRELDCISRALFCPSLVIVDPVGMDDRTKEASRLSPTGDARHLA